MTYRHTIKLYFRYRFTQLNRTTEQPNFNLRILLVCSFKKTLISRTPLKSNLKYRSTSILRKNEGILDKHTTSLIHDGNDEIDNIIEETQTMLFL